MKINRRTFNLGLISATAVAGCDSVGVPADVDKRTVLYSAIDNEITHYDVDVEAGTMVRRASVTLPSNVQYAWPHPSRKFVYVSTSDAPGGAVERPDGIHRLCALRVDGDGALSLHGEPAALPGRPIHNSVDESGEYALTCFSYPARLTVHRINPDGTLGAMVMQDATFDLGSYPHQILTVPGNRQVTLVTRGLGASANGPEEPGSVQLMGFEQGQLQPLQTIQSLNGEGVGYSPRHLDFHPEKPWVYLGIERQNQLFMHEMQEDRLVPEPTFVKDTLAGSYHDRIPQIVGPLHVHPDGRTVYLGNRASGTVEIDGQRVFDEGENNIAVFSIDQDTGEPTLVQHADAQGFHVRSFSIDPTGQLLIAGTMVDMLVRDGDSVQSVAAGLTVFRINSDDGRLTALRKYDIELPSPSSRQIWTRMMELPT